MDKSANKYQSQPYIPKGLTVYKSAVQEKKPSDELVNSMFLTVAEGNYFNVKQFILSSNMSMMSRNISGESVLHIIIKNSNITSTEKKELVKLAISNGAPIGSFDINNITPLHLACKHQLPHIVNILLEFGANPDALDNQYKSPIHYAIVGESVDCPDPHKEKVKPLISNKTQISKTDKLNNDKNIQELTNKLNDFLFNDANTSVFITQIKECFKQLQQMYPYDIKSIVDKNKQEIIDILLDSSSSDENKKIAVFEKVTDIKSSLTEFVTTNIHDSIVPMGITSNLLEGWGPDDAKLQKNKVLPVLGFEEYTRQISSAIDKDKNQILIELQAIFGRLSTDIDKINSIDNDIEHSIQHCHIYFEAINNQLGNRTSPTVFSDLLFTQHVVNATGKKETDYILAIPIISPLKFNFKNKKYLYSTNATANMPHTKTDFNTSTIQNPRRHRMTKSDIENYYKSNDAKIKKIKITDEINMKSNPFPNIDTLTEITSSAYSKSRKYTGVYFNHKLKLYNYFLNVSFNNLKQTISNISISLNSKPHEIYGNLLSNGLIEILNMLMLLLYIDNDIPHILKHTRLLYQFFDSSKQDFTDKDSKFLPEQISDELDELLHKINNLTINTSNVYNSLKELIDNINNQISHIENESTKKCIQSYFPHNESFNDVYTDTNLINITHTKI